MIKITNLVATLSKIRLRHSMIFKEIDSIKSKTKTCQYSCDLQDNVKL